MPQWPPRIVLNAVQVSMLSEAAFCSIAGSFTLGSISWVLFSNWLSYKKDKALGGKYRVMYYASPNKYRVEKAYYRPGNFGFTLPKLYWKSESVWATKEEAVAECKRLQAAGDYEVPLA